MRTHAFAALGGCLLAIAAPAIAASPFDGTWRVDITSATYDQKPDIMVLKDGVFDCQTCTPPYKLTADGKIHTVTGRDYADAMMVAVVDPNTVKSASYKGGKMYSEQTRVVSPDGAMMTVNWRSNYNAQGQWHSGTNTLKRTGPAPDGAHAISGNWVPEVTEATKLDPNAGVFTLALTSSTVTYKSSTGEHYTARIGGPAVKMIGDQAGSTVSVRRISDTVFEETNYVKGKATSINTITLVDPSTLKMSTNDLRAGFVDEIVARKQ